MRPLRLVTGSRECVRSTRTNLMCRDAVQEAKAAGFDIGTEVVLGRVPGVVIGFNIGRHCLFPGHAFPLLVATAQGILKCSAAELTLA